MMAYQVKKTECKSSLPRPSNFRARRGMQVPPCIFAAQRYHVGHHEQCGLRSKISRDPKEKIKTFGVGLALRDLEYPNTHLTASTSRCDVAPAQGTGQRAMMAQAFSAAAAEEMKALGDTWQLRNIQGQKRLEEAVARALKHICRRAERSCVLKALRHSVAQAQDLAEAARLSDEEMQLEAQIASLQRQVDASSERLKSLEHLEANAHQLASPKANSLQELIHQIEAEVPDFSGIEVDSGLEPSLERLGLVQAWLQRTLGQLQEAGEELAEKEKAAASCAFLHLPDEAPNGQSALARLP